VRPLVSFAAICALGAGCAQTIAQDAHSGSDGKSKGAKRIHLGDDGEGRAKGIVTYPGGDRVDWKVFEIPRAGDVDVTLRWSPPKAGEDLAFNILDDTFHVVRRVAPTPDSGKTKKNAQLSNTSAGKYYLQIYAPERGDAGEYDVDVKWTESRAGGIVVAGDPIPNPPRLAAVPGVVAGADKPADKSKPKGSKENPCQVGEACAPGALYVNPGCPTADPMPIGTPCPPQPVINPACPDAGPLMPGAPCPPVILKKQAKIIERRMSGSDVEIILDKGQNQGVGKGWTGVVWKGKTGNTALNKGDFVIYKVTDNESYAKIKGLPLDTFTDNTRVELTSPPPK
jgi:hypothetical protein